jgi:hypothetical protein
MSWHGGSMRSISPWLPLAVLSAPFPAAVNIRKIRSAVRLRDHRSAAAGIASASTKLQIITALCTIN